MGGKKQLKLHNSEGKKVYPYELQYFGFLCPNCRYEVEAILNEPLHARQQLLLRQKDNACSILGPDLHEFHPCQIHE